MRLKLTRPKTIAPLTIILLGLFINTGLGFKSSLNELSFIKDHPNLSREEKLQAKWGMMFDFFNFVNKHTTPDSVIMIPPQIEPQWSISGNRALISYFLYPRRVLNGPVELSAAAIQNFLATHSEITHVLMISEGARLWPNMVPPPDHNLQIYTFRPGWAVIKLK